VFLPIEPGIQVCPEIFGVVGDRYSLPLNGYWDVGMTAQGKVYSSGFESIDSDLPCTGPFHITKKYNFSFREFFKSKLITV